MGETEQLLNSNSISKVCENIEADLNNNLPPWKEASFTQKVHIIVLYCFICLPVLVLLSVVIGGYIIYVTLYIYYLIEGEDDTPEIYYFHSDEEKSNARLRGYIFLIIQTWCLFLVLLSHSRAMFTDPGKIPDTHQWEVPSDGNSESSEDNKQLAERSKKGSTRSCNHCKKKKPDRAHHCRQCNRCNLKMDHHCNWIANCVGYFNYKYFFVMVFYGSISIGLFMATFWECLVVVLNDTDSSTVLCTFVILSYSLISLLGIAVIGFCIFHIWQIKNNYTTIEFCEKKRKNIPGYTKSPFDQGTIYGNFKNALGDNPLIWFLPINCKKPEDGLYFK
ncbi:hypothetical protein SteCoe_22767 [Stentor coeruleus]|uniref:Palmitoyltransferase n=1 Tax=Stentor coeruleus TaxID=5963 RepID=A0A1R2BLE3_9CILI|nr:hypothetical protein SteCoe_22767 [Stentor coeruleus]